MSVSAYLTLLAALLFLATVRAVSLS